MKGTLTSALLFLSTAAAISLPADSPSYGKKRACSQAEIALATGIHLNINGQYAEYNGTLKVEQAETQHAGDAAAFNNAKGQLQAVVQAGQNIRLFNQQIAPAGNPSIPGLAKYQAAQQTEKALAAGLTGCYDTDKAAIDSLKTDIKNGIQLNEENLKAAVSECDFTLKFPPTNEQGA